MNMQIEFRAGRRALREMLWGITGGVGEGGGGGQASPVHSLFVLIVFNLVRVISVAFR